MMPEHNQGRQEAPLAWEPVGEVLAWLLGTAKAAAARQRRDSCGALPLAAHVVHQLHGVHKHVFDACLPQLGGALVLWL